MFIMMCLCLGGSLVYQMYIPLAAEYKSGCVQHHENGTVLTNNLYSIAYNYASDDGNSQGAKALSEYDRRRSEFCSLHSLPSIESYNKDMGELLALQESHERSQHQIGLYEDCINIVSVDEQLADACCAEELYGNSCTVEMAATTEKCPKNPVSGNAYPKISDTLAISEADCGFDLEEKTLIDAIYDCEVLPLCNMVCNGPNKDVLRAVTEDCGCKIQWLGHSAWLKFILALFVYAVLNMSRIGLVMGLCRIFWKQLHNGLFTYKATCARDGSLIVAHADKEGNVTILEKERSISSLASQIEGGSPASQTDAGFQKLLKDDLDVILPKYRRKGIPYIIVALAVNGTWIYLTNAWSSDLEYSEE